MDNSLLRKIMKDIRVELTEEFDLNFERKAFFDRKWTPLSPNYQPTTGSMLIRTGALRRGLRSRIDGTRLIYSNSVPYADIHKLWRKDQTGLCPLDADAPVGVGAIPRDKE